MIRTIMCLFAVVSLCGCVTTPADARRRSIEAKLDAIVIPEVEFKVANPYCVMDYLMKVAMDKDKEHRGISIVNLCDSTEEDNHEITFRAKDISLREALNICCEVGRLRWTIEDSVVKVRALEKTQVHRGIDSILDDVGNGH